MTTLTSTLRMQLIDDVTRPAALVAKAIKEDEERVKRLSDAIKNSGTTDRMQTSLKKLGASASHIEGVTRAWKDFVAQAGVAGKATADLTREENAAIRNWESVSVSAVRAVIREEAALTAAKRREIEARIAEERREEAARKRILENEIAMRRRHEDMLRERASFGHMAATAAATSVTAHSVVSGGEKVLEQGAHLQHERILMSNAGMTAGEIIRLQDEALRLSGIVRNVSQTQVMELGKEIRSVIADPKEVLHILDPIVRAKSVLDAMDRTGAASAGIGQLVKAGEVLGAGQDPKRLAELIEGWVKAMQVMGKTITPDQIYEFAKYTKSAGAQLSDRFLMTVGPSVLQELGGSTTGNDIAMMSRQLTSGFANKHSALREMARIGLIDPNAIDYLATGEAKGLKPGTSKAVKGESLFHTDPDKWVYEVLLPHLEAAGMKDKESQLAFVSKTFIGTAGDFISKLITQRQAFDTHAGLYGSAKGFAAIGENAKDASVGLDALSKAVGNLSAQVSGPAMETIGRGMTRLADGINLVASAAANHPTAAVTAGAAAGAAGLGLSGWLSLQFMRGARSIFGGGKADDAAKTVEGVATGAGKALLSGAAKGLAAGLIYETGKAGIDAVLNALPHPKFPEGYDPNNPGGWKKPSEIAKEPTPGHVDPKTLAVPFSPISFTRDSGAQSMFADAVADGVYRGMTRLLEHPGDFGGGGGGGATVERASYTDEGSGVAGGGGSGGGRFNGIPRAALPGHNGVAPRNLPRGDESVRVRPGTNLDGPATGPAQRFSSPPTGGGGPATSGPVAPFARGRNTFEQKAPEVMRRLMADFGLNKEQAAIILGNLGHESVGFTAYQERNPRAGRGGAGWAQWTGPRRRQFEAWAAEHRLDPHSDEANYGFLQWELSYSKRHAIDNLRRGGSLEQFEHDFEGAGVKAYGSRHNYARRALRAFETGGTPVQSPGPGPQRQPLAETPPSELFGRRRRGGGDERAMNSTVGVDIDAVEHAISRLDVLHEKASAVRHVRINVAHNMEGDHPAAEPSMRHRLNGGYSSDGRNWG